jgi:hypothetical protein
MESPTTAKTFEAASNWLSGASAAATLPNETKLEVNQAAADLVKMSVDMSSYTAFSSTLPQMRDREC